MTVDLVLYFDAHCNLCNGFVDFLIRRDRDRRLRYASLQGVSFVRVRRARPDLESVDSVVAVDDRIPNRVLVKSDAALAALSLLPGPWKAARVLRVIPRFLRDWVYDQVAKRRYSFFGRVDSCRLPSPEERTLFLP